MLNVLGLVVFAGLFWLTARRGATAPRTFRERVAAIVSSAVAAVLGIAPHVLHHAGPLAGAALLAGTGGSLLFGAIGLVAAIPFLLRVHRRCGNWRVPGALLACSRSSSRSRRS